jgi:hypothetical protein
MNNTPTQTEFDDDLTTPEYPVGYFGQPLDVLSVVYTDIANLAMLERGLLPRYFTTEFAKTVGCGGSKLAQKYREVLQTKGSIFYWQHPSYLEFTMYSWTPYPDKLWRLFGILETKNFYENGKMRQDCSTRIAIEMQVAIKETVTRNALDSVLLDPIGA